MSVSSPSHVAVIGGGIFGVSSAVHLLRRGVAVTLVTEGRIGHGASGRSLSWLNSARMRSAAYHALRMAGIDRYRTLFARQPGAPWLRFDGGLTWDADDSGNAIAAVLAHEHRIGYEAQLLQAEEGRRRDPGRRRRRDHSAGAIFNPGEGWVDLPSLIEHLLPEFEPSRRAADGERRPRERRREGGRVRAARLDSGERIEADAVLVAAGPGTPAGVAAARHTHSGHHARLAACRRRSRYAIPLRAVLNTPRVAIRPTPDGAFVLDSGWSEEEVVTRPDGTYEVRESRSHGLLHEAATVLEGNPCWSSRRTGVGPKPIPADGEPVFGASRASRAVSSPSATAEPRSASSPANCSPARSPPASPTPYWLRSAPRASGRREPGRFSRPVRKHRRRETSSREQ